MQVEDGARSLNKGARLDRASRETVAEERLVLVDEVLDLAILRRNLVQGVDVKLAQLLDVHRAAVLVRLVVVLGVVVVHLRCLGVVEAVLVG